MFKYFFQMNYNNLFLFFILIFLSGCISVTYKGKTFPPTTKVDVYLNKGDIKRNFKIIGKAIETGPERVSGLDLEQKLVEKAKEVGAEGMIILSVKKILTGEYYNDGFMDDGPEDWDVDDFSAYTNSFGEVRWSTSTVYNYKTEVKALFIRYLPGNKVRSLIPKPKNK